MKEKNNLLKVIVHSKSSPREITLYSPIYRQYQCKNAFENTPFDEQNIPQSPQEQSIGPSDSGARKDHHSNLISMPSIKHPISFADNYENDSNIMVEKGDSIVYQQNRKEPETKKQNKHNHRTNNLIKNLKNNLIRKLIRTIDISIKKTKY